MPPPKERVKKGAVERKKGLIKKGIDGLDDLSADEGELETHLRTVEDEPAKKKARIEVPPSLQPSSVKQVAGLQEESLLDVSALKFKVRQSSRSLEDDVLGGWENWSTVKRLLTSGGLSTATPEKAAHDILSAERLIASWEQRSWKGRPQFTTNHKKGAPQGRIEGGLAVPSYITATLFLVKAQQCDQRFLTEQQQNEATTAQISGTPRQSPTGGLLPLDTLPASHTTLSAVAAGTLTVTTTRDLVVNTYCMSISRCVQMMQSSGYGDAMIGDAGGSNTYRDRAKTLGMPEEAIEVRNEVAHGSSVPPLTQLRWVCSLVLDWIFDTYWTTQEKELLKMKVIRRQAKAEKVEEVKKVEGHNKAAVHAILGGRTAKGVKAVTADLKSVMAAKPTSTTPAPSAALGGGPLNLSQLKARMSSGQAKPESSAAPVPVIAQGPQYVAIAPNSAWSVLKE